MRRICGPIYAQDGRVTYIHELPDWPKFHWNQDKLAPKLAEVRHRQGRLIGRMEGLGFHLRKEATLQTLTLDVLKSSEIEGEKLNPEQVRLSIARRLGMDIAGAVSADRQVEGVVEMIATRGQRNKQAQIHELQLQYKSAADQAAAKHRMFDIVAEPYKQKGGIPAEDRVLPGAAGATTGWRDPEHKQPKADPEGVPYGGGRADVRIALGGDGELYVLSKSDGMIRKMAAVVTAAKQ